MEESCKSIILKRLQFKKKGSIMCGVSGQVPVLYSVGQLHKKFQTIKNQNICRRLVYDDFSSSCRYMLLNSNRCWCIVRKKGYSKTQESEVNQWFKQ